MEGWRREGPDHSWVFSRWETAVEMHVRMESQTQMLLWRLENWHDPWQLAPPALFLDHSTFSLWSTCTDLPLFSNTWTHAHHQALALAESFSGVFIPQVFNSYPSLSALLSLTTYGIHESAPSPHTRSQTKTSVSQEPFARIRLMLKLSCSSYHS